MRRHELFAGAQSCRWVILTIAAASQSAGEQQWPTQASLSALFRVNNDGRIDRARDKNDDQEKAQ